MDRDIAEKKLRAVYFTEKIDEEIIIEDEQVHHLKNVLRIKENDEVLVLNGNGLRAKAKITSIKKKEIHISIYEKKEVSKEIDLELAIGLPKKENFEDICRIAVEAGIKKIYAVKCDYSQWKYQSSERLEKILISSILQSNNPFIPEIEEVSNVENLLKLDKNIVPMDFCVGKTIENIELERTILFVGPEAGFSDCERALFKNLNCLSMNGPIMRATSAVPIGIGYLRGCTH